ncbi:hypothetical protein [Deinococcus radiodurans]|uniref:Uncharacterized protein n=1 Tax=Deinococcus radiodurans (strain ATCC 13939 / DSM 20539 / JCM 16871 / CCUG 27074 / LMG 4051 / NBRC 15346 / NCIMB 9279 / VKM B-1422 / R1) TaxID=243230 RepID=Q9RYN0_DEIRA|nr:hypothetical protein [Deinococcus radiodurans]AAF12530.1 hypothetical protein DR_A0281 [Deinococcus radiodurans R1 = ATCC 13939 = DSM 20539]
MKFNRPLSLALLSGALLLASCGNTPAGGTTPGGTNTGDTTNTGGIKVNPITGTGNATLSADVVRSNRGAAVEGSTVYLYRTGDRSALSARPAPTPRATSSSPRFRRAATTWCS